MSRIKRTSPALVISILALVAAVAVPSLAQVAITALTKKEKRVVRKIAKRQANAQITRRAPGLSVAHANTAGRAADADAVGGQPLATIAVGRSDPTTGGQCDPTSTTFVLCADVSVDLPHAGRVLLIGTGAQYAFSTGVTQGNCRLTTDGDALGGSVVGLGNQTDPSPGVTGADNRGYARGFSTTIVTDPVSAGSHSFGLQCNENDGDVEFENPQISAVLLGSG
jgi:hypothetical protein